MTKPWPLVLMYHGIIPEVRGRHCTEFQVIYQDEFERHLRRLRKYYVILHPDEFVDYLKNNRPFPTRSAMVTLDDGFQNALDYALPVAESVKVPILLFLSSGHMDGGDWLWFSRLLAMRLSNSEEEGQISRSYRSLTFDALNMELDRVEAPTRANGDIFFQMLLDGINSLELAKHSQNPFLAIGGHTVNHPRLVNEKVDSLRQEISDNKIRLEQVIGREVNLFAYPQGVYNQEVAHEVRDAGYLGAFTASKTKISVPVDLNHFQIPRVGMYLPGMFWYWYKCMGISGQVELLKSKINPQSLYIS